MRSCSHAWDLCEICMYYTLVTRFTSSCSCGIGSLCEGAFLCVREPTARTISEDFNGQ